MMRGDKMFTDNGRGQTQEVEVKSVGPKYVTVWIPKWNSPGQKFSREVGPTGAHYGEFGYRLWPSLEARALAHWRDAAILKIHEAIRSTSRTIPEEKLRAIVEILGIDVTP